jgi:hypothetical protein
MLEMLDLCADELEEEEPDELLELDDDLLELDDDLLELDDDLLELDDDLLELDDDFLLEEGDGLGGGLLRLDGKLLDGGLNELGSDGDDKLDGNKLEGEGLEGKLLDGAGLEGKLLDGKPDDSPRDIFHILRSRLTKTGTPAIAA